jgi:hypothetical protein
MSFKFTGLWRHADFVRLWVGQTVSVFGSLVGGLAMDFTAVLWLGASPIEISILSGCRLVPGFVVGLVAGVDRLPRRPILVTADAGRAVSLASVPVAAVFGVLTIEQLWLVALVTSGLTVLFNAAYEAYLPTLVSRDELVEGNSKLTATASLSEYGAFSASGWLVQLFSGPGAVLVDAASFVVSAVSVWLIRAPEAAPSNPEAQRHVLREIEEGLRVVAGDPLLRSMGIATVILDFARPFVGVAFLLYLNKEVGFNPGVLGMIFAVGGLTSLAGAAVAGRWSWFGGLGRGLALSIFVRAAGMAFMPLATSVSLLGGSYLVMNQVVTDPAWTFYEINTVSVRQAIAPERLRGRISACLHFLSFGAMLLGTVVAGLVAERVGLREALFAASGLTVLAGVFLLLSPLSRLRGLPEAIPG